MSLKRRIYTKQFKQQVLRELDACLPLAQVARQHAISAKLLQRWHEEFAEYGEDAFAGNGRSYKDQARIAELERCVSRQTLEVLSQKARGHLAALGFSDIVQYRNTCQVSALEAYGHGGQRQEDPPPDAGRETAVLPSEALCGHHRQRP